MLLITYLCSREAESGTDVLAEQRVQVPPRRFRVRDVCVTVVEPRKQIFTTPPFLCIEFFASRPSSQSIA
jgi:hypothetical protein